MLVLYIRIKLETTMMVGLLNTINFPNGPASFMQDWGILQILNILMQLKKFARMDGPRSLGFLDVFGVNLQNAFHYLEKRYSCSYPGY